MCAWWSAENEPSNGAAKPKSPNLQTNKSSAKQPRSEIVQPFHDTQDGNSFEPDVQESKDCSGLAHREEAEGARPLEHLSLDGLASPAANQECVEEACCEKSLSETETSNENSSPILSPVYNISLQV